MNLIKETYNHIFLHQGQVLENYRNTRITCISYCPQVVAIRDIIPPPQRNAFNDVYIAYELMDTDLHQIIRSNQALSEEHCQVLLQILVRINMLKRILLFCTIYLASCSY